MNATLKGKLHEAIGAAVNVIGTNGLGGDDDDVAVLTILRRMVSQANRREARAPATPPAPPAQEP